MLTKLNNGIGPKQQIQKQKNYHYEFCRSRNDGELKWTGFASMSLGWTLNGQDHILVSVLEKTYHMSRSGHVQAVLFVLAKMRNNLNGHQEKENNKLNYSVSTMK